MSALPTVFVSHGPPTLPFEAGPAREALVRLGSELARPTAILCVSAQEAPQGRRNHPSDEHFLPLLVAAGAAEGEPGTALHRGWLYGALSMASYRFGAAAA